MGTPAIRNPPTSPAPSSPISGIGYQAAAAASFVSVVWTLLITETTEMRPDVVESGCAATTSIDVISGAAARTASSTAYSRVIAEDGQLLQLPANSSRTTGPSWPSATSSSETSPPCE